MIRKGFLFFNLHSDIFSSLAANPKIYLRITYVNFNKIGPSTWDRYNRVLSKFLVCTSKGILYVCPRSKSLQVSHFLFQGDFVSPTKNVIVDAGAMQFHVTELREFTEYTFYVSAFNANGEGALSEEITCMTLSDIPADPPQNISLEASSSTSIIGE